MDVRLPDGTIIQNVPDGTTKADLVAKLQRNGHAVPSEWLAQTPPSEPAAVQAGGAIRDAGRQVGLTARYGMEGPAQALSVFTEPIRQYITDPLVRLALGRNPLDPKQGSSPSAAAMAGQAADAVGLPAPQGANERVVGDVTRLMSGAGALGLGGKAAQATEAAPNVIRKLGEMFSAKPGQTIVSAAGAGGAGGAVREAGGSQLEQFFASLAGGIAAPTVANLTASGGRKVADAARNLADYVAPGAIKPQNVDQTISLVLQRSGVDWAQVPERVRQTMRQEVQAAMSTGGELDPAAVNRLLAFARTGTTPTRGMLTQDPVQITREKNLAKTGANSTDLGLQRLPQLENRNTQRLLDVLDEQGARNAPDSFSAGQRLLGALNRNAATSKSRIDSLYSAARDTSGRSAELDGASFSQRANQLLDEGLLGGALPQGVATRMNQIAKGEVPFTVDFAEQFKTSIGKLQRATADGQARMALGKVREALDQTPLRAAPQVNPGNLPAVPGTVPPSPAALGEESIGAFNRARQANAAFMKRVEETPALAAALDGAQPDRFVQQFIIGSGATVKDVNALRRAVANDPQALDAVRANIAAHLKGAATNGTEDVTKFSPAAYNKALNNIGERKLSAFFSTDEIATLKDVGRAGTYMTAQPAGSAVNNSNSGALLLGRGLDLLDTVAGRLPFGLKDTLQGTLRGVQQGRALSVPQALLIPPQPSMPLLQRLAPAGIYGGLLATQPIDQR